MRSTIGRKVTTSLNRPRSRPFSSCIGKRLAEGNPVIGRASSLLSSPDRCILPALLSSSTPPPFLPIFPRREKSSPPSRVGPCAREVQIETKEYWRERRTGDALERARDDRRRIEQRNRGRLHFSSKRGAREGEGKFLFNSIKLFLCRARRCSNGPVYLLAYRDGRKESIKSKLGRDGGGFARDFVTSGRCFIDLNPLTGGTLRGYSPIVFTARDALEISSRPLPPRGEGSTYLRGFMSLPLVVKVS